MSLLEQLAASNAVHRIRKGACESLTPEHVLALKQWVMSSGMAPGQREHFLGILESHEHLRTERILITLENR